MIPLKSNGLGQLHSSLSSFIEGYDSEKYKHFPPSVLFFLEVMTNIVSTHIDKSVNPNSVPFVNKESTLSLIFIPLENIRVLV